jgi:hypothetical protein
MVSQLASTGQIILPDRTVPVSKDRKRYSKLDGQFKRWAEMLFAAHQHYSRSAG